MCQHDGCKTRPNFNFERHSKPIFCSQHKQEGMINVKSKRCSHDQCKKQPNFNFEGRKIAIFCSQHKQKGMIDIKSKRCEHDGCKTIPNYNFKGESKAIFCSQHKQEGMIDINNIKCHQEGCHKHPVFNFEKQKKAIFCFEHKQEGMIDIKHKTCEQEGCKTRPNFNFEGRKMAIFCSEHKQEGMIDIKNKKCEQEGCETRPSCNFYGQLKAIFCSQHKQEGMVDIVSKTCKYDWCSTRVTDKYDGYCLRCFIHTFPDKKVSRNYKTKEFAVVEFVKEWFPNLTWITDKKVQGGCSKRRPDMFLNVGDQVLMIEVDENQHMPYDCSCQNKRIMELSQDVGHIPIVFIRFNPDSYIIEGGKNVSSCWGTNQKGMCVVRKSKQSEWKTRLLTLVDQIDYWLEHRTDRTVESVELFYNN
jgi:hypothetical protein